MRPRFFLFALALALALPAASGFEVAQAQTIQPNWSMPGQDRRAGRQESGRQEILSLRDVVEMVRGRYGGELVGARLERGDPPVYVLRWRLPNNEVTDFRVDGVSGRVFR